MLISRPHLNLDQLSTRERILHLHFLQKYSQLTHTSSKNEPMHSRCVHHSLCSRDLIKFLAPPFFSLSCITVFNDKQPGLAACLVEPQFASNFKTLSFAVQIRGRKEDNCLPLLMLYIASPIRTYNFINLTSKPR